MRRGHLTSITEHFHLKLNITELYHLSFRFIEILLPNLVVLLNRHCKWLIGITELLLLDLMLLMVAAAHQYYRAPPPPT